MTYVPQTDADRAEMLATIGMERVEDLFHDVPANCRFPELKLPEPLSENRETQICQVLDEKFGHPFEYRFVYVDDIPRAANGKFEEFMSEVT